MSSANFASAARYTSQHITRWSLEWSSLLHRADDLGRETLLTNVDPSSFETQLASPFPARRYFIMKCLSDDEITWSLSTNLWSTQKHNELVLNQAIKVFVFVYLLLNSVRHPKFILFSAWIEVAPSMVTRVCCRELPKGLPSLNRTRIRVRSTHQKLPLWTLVVWKSKSRQKQHLLLVVK